ncbi:DUF4149 domain-containing protein [Variovorax sp. MHTC-1]|uniref:DUF4149 domain-containing protein n=1 Tax=Variovorax sp. MHTC-1 TaxID=2495593 RepID=UPI000F886047|nr:DUF4149 domain-containing protein [Variovorax sp. MHTC-1]RST56682.1 DUF4149 domain-containing protein [Variovorax sp. MHTC-1]
MKDRLALLLAALWWGSLTTIGFLVVPMLFAQLGNPSLAGNFAGRLFAAQSWVALACGLALLTYFRSKVQEDLADRSSRTAVGWIVVALLLALLQEYAVAPRILARENLRLWHSLGSAMYLGQWLCAGVLLWRMGRRLD